MGGFEQHEIPFEGKRKSLRLRRGIYLLPSMFTVANLLCGYYAVVATLLASAEHMDNFDHAAKAIGYAILFDSLDGRVARMTGTNTEFGKQFDSLADVVSFGIAPGVLAYAWGVRYLSGSGIIPQQQLGQAGWLLCLMFVICCAWRLARFNVHGMAPGSSRYFVGLPTPAAAGVLAAAVHAFRYPIQDWRWAVAWVVLAGCLAALMTSTIRFSSFKDVAWTRRHSSLAIVLLGLLVGGIVMYSRVVLLLVSGSYVAIGVALHLVRFVRYRFVSRAA